MEYHFPHHPNHDHLAHLSQASYPEHQHLIHGYSITQSQSSMLAMPHGTKTNETKPRLGKEEVDILEREFKRNPKPTTQTKRGFAEQMNVDLARINNWFQNRRAKRKQEKKQEAYEAGQVQDALGFSEPSSPEYFQNNYMADNQVLSMQSTSTPFSLNGPPPATAPYNPQYHDPTTASLESLQRTMAAAQAASSTHDFSGGYVSHDGLPFGGSLSLHDPSHLDRAQFPSVSSSLGHFDASHFGFQSNYQDSLFNAAVQSEISDSGNTPTPFTTFADVENAGSLSMQSFPSQLIPQSFTEALALRPHESNDGQASENSNEATPSLGFQYESPESAESSLSPPPASSLFKSPPPPTDLAARRKKVHVKPAALGTDTMRSRPSLGPRTVSQAEGFRRQVASPLPSPMRRIVSAGGNRNVLSGRVQKQGVESAQRSPINLGGFENVDSFVEQNYHHIRLPPSLTAGSSLNSSLAPPTPMSPRERKMSLENRENSISSASSSEGGLNYLYNGDLGCIAAVDSAQVTDQTPPETPQAQLGLQSASGGWPSGSERHDSQWGFDVSDEPLFTPGHDSFPVELQMPQPSYPSSFSQPVTPAFGQFSQGFVYDDEVPHFKETSPIFSLSNQGQQSEYSFPDAHGYPMGMVGSSPTMTKQKQFQFSNTTAADFSEK
ncbi:homeobox domain-containing protein [Rutstroemia sp. NJR-2017a BVV2]|nr:homeobox domain-containing protein [Rutstroemia sp. NJR-2017a BVV2]